MIRMLRLLTVLVTLSGFANCGPLEADGVSPLAELRQGVRRAPKITSVYPPACANEGGCELIVTGENLLSDTTVRLTNAATSQTALATVLRELSSTEIAIKVPPVGSLGSAYWLDITVENAPALEATRTESFIYFADDLDLIPMDTLRASSQPCDAVSEDFDGDGKRDVIIAACGTSSKKLYLYPNKDVHSYKDPSVIPLTGRPLAIAAAYLDAGSTVDLLVLTDTPGQELQVMLGDGAGRFSTVKPGTTAANTYAASNASALSIGDFTGDGKTDVAVDGSGLVYIYAGSSAGMLTKLQELTTTARAMGWYSAHLLSATDLNDDGYADLVAADPYVPSRDPKLAGLEIFLNAKSATTPFGSPKPYYPGLPVSAVQIENVVGDSKPDLMIADASKNQVYVLRNTAGTFPSPLPAPIGTTRGPRINALVFADTSGDAVLDLIANTNTGPEAFVSGTLGFAAPVPIDLATQGAQLRVLNLDSDPYRDLAFLGSTGPAFDYRSSQDLVTLVYGSRDGIVPVGRTAPQNGGFGTSQLSAIIAVPDPSPYLLAADAGRFLDAGYTFLPTDGIMKQGLIAVGFGTYPAALASLNYNKDAFYDAVSADYLSDTITFVRGQGRGRVGYPTSFTLNQVKNPWVITAADLMKDMVQSAVVVAGENGYAALYTSDMMGKLSYQRSFTMSARALAFADVYKDDGNQELIVAKADADEVWLLPYNNMTVFNEAMPEKLAARGKRPMALATQDFDADGKADLLVVVNREPEPGNPRNVAVFVKKMGKLEYDPYKSFQSCKLPDAVTFTNVGGDSAPDLLISCDGDKSLRVYYNLGRGAFGTSAQIISRPAPGPISAIDVDGDTRKELVLGHEMGATFTLVHNLTKLP